MSPLLTARVPLARQRGMTLVELMVAMVLGLIITLAAVAALLVSRQGFFTVDAASQLRDNARFAQDMVQRIGVQAGFRNVFFMKGGGVSSAGLDANPEPDVFGLNNKKRSPGKPWDGGSSWGSGDLGKNSDILVLRTQVSTANESATESDGTMINCLGVAPAAVPTHRDDRFISILHVQAGSDGEPALMCTYEASSGGFASQPLVQGVENFQVLYGVDGVVPGAAGPSLAADSVPERYLRADQLTVAGDEVASYANWRRVRSLRIGMVLRSLPGSAIDTDAQTFYPLGASRASAATSSPGGAFSSSSDKQTEFKSPADGRLRQAVTFTVHLRNFQDLESF